MKRTEQSPLNSQGIEIWPSISAAW